MSLAGPPPKRTVSILALTMGAACCNLKAGTCKGDLLALSPSALTGVQATLVGTAFRFASILATEPEKGRSRAPGARLTEAVCLCEKRGWRRSEGRWGWSCDGETDMQGAERGREGRGEVYVANILASRCREMGCDD